MQLIDMKLQKCLGDMQSTPEWEAVRKRNAYVNIYNPGFDFMGFLETANRRNDRPNEETRRYLN